MATVTKSIGTGTGSAGTGTVSCSATTAVTGSVDAIFTSELTAPGTIEISGTLYDIASITDDTNLVLISNGPTATDVAFNIGLRHYSTITLWEGDLDDGGIYSASDTAVGEMYDDSVFDEAVTINANSVGMALFTLRVASGERHDGTAGTGARIVCSGAKAASIILGYVLVTYCNVYVEWLEVDGGGYGHGGNNGLISFNTAVTSTDGSRAINCIAHDSTSSSGRGFHSQKASDFLNCVIYDITATAGVGFYMQSTDQTRLHNCVAHGCYDNVYMTDDVDHTIRNTIATSPGRYDFSISSPSNTDIDYCLSSNTSASGTNSLISKAAADQFVSTTGGSEDFHLKAGADAINAGADLGTSPTDVNLDIDGYDRNASGVTWDMGVHEYLGDYPNTTIGTTNRDYSTMTLWEADLDNTDAYSSSDDAVGECYDDSDFDESVVINGGFTVGLNEITLTVATGSRHDGTAGTGACIKRSAGTGNILSHAYAGQITVGHIVEWLEIDATTGSDGDRKWISINFRSTQHRAKIRNCIVHGASSWDNVARQGIILYGKSGQENSVTNCIIYDVSMTYTSWTGSFFGIYNENNTAYIQNNTVHNIFSSNASATSAAYGIGWDDVAGRTVQNNIVTDTTNAGSGAGQDYEHSSPSSSTVDHNLASDTSASGTGSLDSKTAANQFVNTGAGTEDLHLKSGADAINAGTDLVTTPTGVNLDIDGYDRNASGANWDMGADEYLGDYPNTTIGTTNRDYSTMILWEDDFDNTDIYSASDAVVGECYDDTAFTAGVPIYSGSIIGLGSITLRAATGEEHDGTAGTGVRVVAADVLTKIEVSDGPGCSVVVEDIEIDWNGYSFGYFQSSTMSTELCVFRRCIGHGIEHDFFTVGEAIAFYLGTFFDSVRIPAAVNCLAYDIQMISGTTGPAGFYALNDSNRILNCTAANIKSNSGQSHDAVGIYSNTGDVLNCIAMDVGGSGAGTHKDFGAGTTTGTQDYCMSEDDTADDDSGANCLINKTYANQFVNTGSGTEDYHLKSGADAINAGTDLGTTSDVNLDIDGYDRNASGANWDMGADEYITDYPLTTIGTTNRDYSTITLWEADMDVTEMYAPSDDMIGEMYDDSAFDEAFNIAGGSVSNIDSRTLTAATGEEHDGTAGSGVRIVASADRTWVVTSTPCTLSWIEFDANGNRAMVDVQANSSSDPTIVQNCLVHDQTTSAWHSVGIYGAYVNAFTCTNNIVYNITCTHGTVRSAWGIYGWSTTRDVYIENCTVWNIINNNGTGGAVGIYVADDTQTVLRNCISMDPSGTASGNIGCYYPATFSLSTVGYNMASDTTAYGTGSLNSKSSGSQFASTGGGTEDLHLKDGSDAIDVGLDLIATPSGVEVDIDGRDRNAEGDTWDMGAHEYIDISVVVDHDTDALLQAIQTVDHDTDAFLAAAAASTVTHDTDALLQDIVTVTHDTDSYLYDVVTKEHTSDALLQDIVTATHDTDSLLQDIVTITHDTDSLLQAVQTVEHTTDAYLQGTTITHDTDALLQAIQTVEHATDAVLQAIQTVEHTTDAYLTGTSTSDHTTDALLQAIVTVEHTTDAYLTGTSTVVHTTDALLQEISTIEHTTDAYLHYIKEVIHTTDAFIISVFSSAHTTDAYLTGTSTIIHTTDAYLQSANTASHDTDAVLQAIQTEEHTSDALLQGIYSEAHTTDAYLIYVLTQDHTTDALLQGILTVEHTTDAYLINVFAQDHATDAVLQAIQTAEHATDSLLYNALSLEHTADSLLQAIQTTEHTTDAYLINVFAQDHATDALLQEISTVEHTTDAYLIYTFTQDHTTDAYLWGIGTSEHATDSFLGIAGSITHTSDALLLAIQTSDHTSDALLSAEFVADHTSDAFLYSSIGEYHSTDSLLTAENEVEHSTDGYLFIALAAIHATDAYLWAAGSEDHSTDSTLWEEVDNEHMTDAFLSEAEGIGHATDGYLIYRPELVHVTDSILVLSWVGHATDSVLIPSGRVHGTNSFLVVSTIGRGVFSEALFPAPMGSWF